MSSAGKIIRPEWVPEAYKEKAADKPLPIKVTRAVSQIVKKCGLHRKRK